MPQWLQDLPSVLDRVAEADLMHVMLTLGVLMLAALLVGLLGSYLRLPKVTSFLLAGVAVGPLIPEEHIEQLEPLTRLAIALVLFNLGCHFPIPRLRKILRRVCRLSAGELLTTFALVTGGILLLGAEWEVATLLGVLALATAPATTILVLKETESEGPVTEYTNSLVAMNNLVSICLFELFFLGIVVWHGQLDASPMAQVGHLVQDLAGSVALGVVCGLMVSYAFGVVAESRRLALLVGMTAVALAIASIAEMPYLLVFLAMGMTVANSSYQSRQVLAELDRLTGLLCVLFFVTHGAELKLGKLAEAGLIGIAYLALRSSGKYLGIRIASRSRHGEPEVRKWLGTALIAQAGAAIALSEIAVDSTIAGTPLREMCLRVQTIILGTVVVFEIFGPLLIRNAVYQAGEVPLAHAIHHPGPSLWDQAKIVFNRVLLAFGLNPWNNRSEADLTVRDLMRMNVPSIPSSATFDEVIECIEHSRDNTFPVVDTNGGMLGVIRYRELSHALFDRGLGTLVRAADVTTPAGRLLYPDEPIARASSMFAASKDDCIPVVSPDEPHQLLGVIRRRDVLRLLVRNQK